MKKDVYELSKPQESIWLTEQYFKDTNINRLVTLADFSKKIENLDFNKLNKAINNVVRYNDNFQIRLFLENGNIKQYFCDYKEFQCEEIEITSLSDFLEEDSRRQGVFTLLESPLYEFRLFKIKGTNTGGILANFHHLVCDGFAASLCVRQIYESYMSLINSDTLPNLNPENHSYVQYLESEKEYLSSKKFEKDKAYWEEIFQTVPEVASVYSNKGANSEFSPEADRVTYSIQKDKMAEITNLCSKIKISPYNFFMAVYGIYISRASRLEDFAIGTPILNRTNFREKQTLGMYVSTVPFRLKLDQNLSFTEYSMQIAKDTMSMLRHQKYSYGYIIENLRKKASSVPNLYNIIFSYQVSSAADEESGYDADWLSNHCISGDLDINIYDLNTKSEASVSYDYNLNKYSEEDIKSMHTRVLTIIDQILKNENIQLKDIDIVTKQEKAQILNEFNNTITEYPREKSVIQLFEEQVEKTPEATAVCFEEKTLTYKELNQKANSLANYLKTKGIKNHDVCALYLDKSLEAIVSIIATLKLGAGYLPIDISYPMDRITYMIKDSNAKVFLVSSDLDTNFKLNIPKVIVDLSSKIYNNTEKFENPKTSPKDLAYIIYTSGSTGKPKGVMVPNRAIVRLVKNTNFIEFSKGDKILQTGTIAFDASTFEIWGALLNGLELYLLKKTDLLNPEYFGNYIKENKITSLFLTTSLFNKFSEYNPKMFGVLKYLLVGGEALSYKHIKTVREANPDLNIVNGYGPTENTTFSAYYNIKDMSQGFIPIGFPLANSTGYVVSKTGNLMPIGVPGELWVGGDGLALGYLNRKELTEEKFIDNPFGEGKVYKTGDLVCLLPNGAINYIGRIDNQVKLRGFRIELSEIDTKILEFSGIKESVTIINSNTICSYIVTENEVSLEKLKKHLREELPAFMVPSFITKLEALPLNVNGKVDKKKLPIPALGDENKEISTPRNDIDKAIIEELEEILKIKNISIKDSFFGIGGDSLNAITLCMHLSSKLGSAVSVKDIFDNPVIEHLSDAIAKTHETIEKTIKKVEEREYYPLSCAQKRIYYANTVSGNKNIVYNVSGGMLFKEILAPTKVEVALNKLIELHSSFRTSFKYENGELVQKVQESVQIQFEIEHSNLSAQELVNKFPKPFDLSKAPLLRAKMYILDDSSSLLLLDTHHIIVDGTSLAIIFNDFCKLYNGEQIEESELKYTDYAVWENEFINSDKIKPYEEYWTKKLKSQELAVLNLPYDYPLTNVKTYKGETVSITLTDNEFSAFESFAKMQNISTYSVFLTALYVLLYKYTAQTEIVIGGPYAGRSFPEIQEIVGMFVNNIVLNEHIEKEASFEELAKKVHENVMQAILNQPYPYELLQKALNLSSNNSLLDVMFTYQNIETQVPTIHGKPAQVLTAKSDTSKFNLWFEIIPQTKTFNLEFNTNLFKNNTAQSILEHYLFILKNAIQRPENSVNNFEMITEKEEKLLEKFNDTYMKVNNDTIMDIFENQVIKTPNKIAVVCEDKALTYKELNEKANSLAHYLIRAGIKPNDIVCIMTNRSLETIVSMLGILKAGAAFFNVDPTYPVERTKYYIEDSKTKYVLTQSELKDKVKTIENCIEIDLSNEKIYGEQFVNPHVKLKQTDLSYIIYTSGSTGTPKGVMLNQVRICKHGKSNDICT